MAEDVTTLLIRMITGGSSQVDGLAVNNSFVGSTGDLVSSVANYVQIIGNDEAPIAQYVSTIFANAEVDAAKAGAAAEAEGLSKDAVKNAVDAVDTTGVAALATLEVSVVAAVLVTLASILISLVDSTSGPDPLQALGKELVGVLGQGALGNYWLSKLTGPLTTFWSPVGEDLDDLAHEGTGTKNNPAPDVQHNVSHYHDDANRFIQLLVGGDPGSDQYWQVLSPSLGVGDQPQSSNPPTSILGLAPSPDNPPYAIYAWQYISWYGKFPTRQSIDNSPSGNVSDPRTMIPVLALGIRSYLNLSVLLHYINPTQLTFRKFLDDWGTELQSYAGFMYTKYAEAVNGIVRTAIPSESEILGFLWGLTQNAGVFASLDTQPDASTRQSWGAPMPHLGEYSRNVPPAVAYSGDGWGWNGIYGASETYPQYGFYGNAQIDPSQSNIFTPAYIVSFLDGSSAVSEWQNARILFNVESSTVVSEYSLSVWVIPWLQNRIILGRMARWKAIYLINGFDGVWSVLQALQRLVAPTPPVVPLTLDDGTIANGNWSARELCKVVLVTGSLLTGTDVSEGNQFIVSTPVSGHSVAALLQFLYNIANGKWTGPPPYYVPAGVPSGMTGVAGPPRPLSFRGLLATAAM
jgi:hypothetical protein